MKAILFKFNFDINYQVDYCLSGKEALHMLKETYANGYEYQLIFTDFNMPGMNGIEATYKIREFLKGRKNQPKIIGVTGNASGEFSKEGEKAGMNIVVTKPLYVRDLKTILKKFNMLDIE
jgi:two-component system sensor histidine kinase/response regulator